MKHLPLIAYTLSISFLLLVSTACSRSTKTTEQKKKEKSAMEELTQATHDIRAEQARQLETDQGLGLNNSGAEKFLAAAKKLEKASTGDEAKMAKVGRIFAESVQKDMASLAKYEKGLSAAMDYSTIQTPEDIDPLSEKVKLYQKANDALTRKIRGGWYQTIRENLAKEGLPKQTIENFMKGATSSLERQRPFLITIRKADNDLCEAILSHHAILKKHFGKWQWDAEEEIPVFEDDPAVEAYNIHSKKIQKAAKRQYEAQQKLLNK